MTDISCDNCINQKLVEIPNDLYYVCKLRDTCILECDVAEKFGCSDYKVIE
jgi:hypothetical protein